MYLYTGELVYVKSQLQENKIKIWIENSPDYRS